MYFVTFPVASTNIFPQSNSKYGGQLVTEYNLRAREMVNTSPTIKYEVGPSFVHSPEDFEVRIQQDDAGYIISQSTLEIMPGRGVINGHYIQTLAPMIVDMLEANSMLKSQQRAPLKGELEVGIRIFYSTEPTMAGTMLVDNVYEMYEGVQLVVLPKGELILPIETPTDRSKVTAHIRLASFTFLNGTITSVKNMNDEKCKCMSAERISNVDMLLSDAYIKKSRLNPKRLYTFSGKGTDPNTGYDTWCDSTDSLMVWDNSPERTTVNPNLREASFGTSTNGKTILAIPHKQVDGMTDNQGNKEYYAPRIMELPVANYEQGTSGTVDKEYTRHIKDIAERFNLFHQIVKGKQVYYIDIKQVDTELPPLNANWSVGDYILVGQDYTADIDTDSVRAPSTMYAIIPGLVESIKYITQVSNSDAVPSQLVGAQLGSIVLDASNDDSLPSTSSDPTTYPIFFDQEDGVRGVPEQDYFVVTYMDGDEYTKYYYVVDKASSKTYSNYLLLTGEIPLAQEEVIGGFLNVPVETLDGGYVHRDENGHLRLLDYALLRSGTLAYQLGEDIELPSGLTTEEVQSHLDEYVNERVVFPNTSQAQKSSTPNVINVDIYLSKEEVPVELTIRDIDSRFGASICINILGEADSNTTINILNCEKVRVSNNISGTPVINMYRCGVYYDAALFDYIRGCKRNVPFTGFQDIKLWYEMYEESDPNLLVDNMTVSELDAPIIAEDIDFWNVSALNDNHYRCALRSITFSGTGDIVRCGLLIANDSTNNVELGHKIVAADFELPQGSGLVYPKTCMTKQLKVTGTFVSSYYSDNTWVVTDTHFTAVTSAYDPYDLTRTTKGSIALHSETNLINAIVDFTEDVIPGWEPDTYHLFEGGVIS